MDSKIKSKNTQLEIIRAIACLIVMLGHIYTKTEGLPEFTFLSYLLNWGTESVIVFFILSGFVIQISQEKREKKFGEFIVNRFIRIYPLYFVAILLTFAVAQTTGSTASFSQMLGHMLFLQTLQGFLVGVFPTNEALWSLSYEAFFYLAFSLSLIYRKILYIWISLSLMCWFFYDISLTSNVLNHFKMLFAYSVIWLLGYSIAYCRHLFKFEKTFAFSLIPLAFAFSRIHFIDNFYDIYRLTGFAILLLPLFNVYTSKSEKTIRIKSYIVCGICTLVLVLLWNFSNSDYSTKFLFSIVSISGMITPKIPKNIYSSLKNVEIVNLKEIFVYIASISYALYVIHMPILYGLEFLIEEKSLIRATLTLIITFVFAHIFDLIIQPQIAILFKKIIYGFKLKYSKI